MESKYKKGDQIEFTYNGIYVGVFTVFDLYDLGEPYHRLVALDDKGNSLDLDLTSS